MKTAEFFDRGLAGFAQLDIAQQQAFFCILQEGSLTVSTKRMSVCKTVPCKRVISTQANPGHFRDLGFCLCFPQHHWKTAKHCMCHDPTQQAASHSWEFRTLVSSSSRYESVRDFLHGRMGKTPGRKRISVARSDGRSREPAAYPVHP